MRIKPLILIGLAALGVGTGTAQASVVVLGNNAGAVCYRSARASLGTPQALAVCNQALAGGQLSAKDVVGTHVNRGIVKLMAKDYQGALADFDQAIALDPTEPESYLNKGSTFIRMGSSPAQALPLFQEALDRKTSRPELAYFGRGIAHELSGNLQSAYLDYKRASELAPRWDQPAREMSRFQVRRAGTGM